MPTAVKTKVSDLRKEVDLLRSFVIGLSGKDPEGDYRPEFVRRIFKTLVAGPRHQFRDAASFLAHLRQKRSR